MRDVEINELCRGDIILLLHSNGEEGTFEVGNISLARRSILARPNWYKSGYHLFKIEEGKKIKLVKSMDWDN
jgi:hypothetical protein